METPSSTLNERLESVWKRNQIKHVYSALMAFVVWAIPIFLLGVLIDRFAYLPPLARILVLIFLFGVSIYNAWKSGGKFLHRYDAIRSARQIEGHHTVLDSLLTTAVQYRDQGATPGTSTSLWQASLRNAEQAMREIQPSNIVSYGALRRPLQISGIMLLVIAAMAFINGPFLAAGFARIFNPWSNVAYPTKTLIGIDHHKLLVKEGDSAKIEVKLSGSVPENARLELVTGGGKPKEIVLEIRGNKAAYSIASASRDFKYRIKAGDARSDWHDVRVVPAPRIIQAQLSLQYPEYQKRPMETVEALTLTVPEGTKVKWQLTLDQPIEKAQLHRDGVASLDLEVRNDGRQVLVEESVIASRGYHFSWVEKKHAFSFESPRYFLQVSADAAPRIEYITPSSNVFAMLDRQLDFAVRAQDDHGIAVTNITYRVNLRPEKTVTLATPIRSTEGEQRVDWDYRKEIPDLQIGDSVSFIIEIADNYPGAEGAHRVRTDTRRITFLSRDDYLAQINAKMDRLLTRVRAIYRQERAAHLLVRELDPAQDSFTQTCQLEAIRQEMMREQLNLAAAETRLLLADLAANNITADASNASLKQLADSMESVAEKSIAQAATILRGQAGAQQKKSTDLITADVTVNQAARELATIVMQRGIDASREVFALETQMLSREQSSLRARGLVSTLDAEGRERLAKHQEELAAWTNELLEKIQATMRYEKRPLYVLHLTRRMTDLRKSNALAQMKQAASLIRSGDTIKAAQEQAAAIKALLTAEFSVRTGAEYNAITNASKTLATLLADQSQLRADCESKNIDAAITTRQQIIHDTLLKLTLPEIPTPRTRLYQETPPQASAIDALRLTAEAATSESIDWLKSNKREDAIAAQRKAEIALTELNQQVAKAAIDISMRTEGISTLVSAAVKRLSSITDIETRQVQLLEQCEEAALDEKPTKPLAENQQRLATDLHLFKNDLLDEGDSNKDIAALVNQVDAIAKLMASAAAAMDANKGEDALDPIEKSADAITTLKTMIEAQSKRVALLQEIFGFQRAVGSASLTMLDLIATQNELITATEDAEEEELEKLLPTFNNLLQCITDVAPIFDLVAKRVDVGSALLFAGSDMEDAIAAIEDGDADDALDAQEVATESLAKVQGLIQSVCEQHGYLAEILEFLNVSLADISLIESGQQQLRLALEAAPDKIAPKTAQRQEELQKAAATVANALLKTTGSQDFSAASSSMADAAKALKTNDANAALNSMTQSEAALRAHSERIVIIMTVLHGLSSIEVLPTSPPELPELIEILALASDQKTLQRKLLFNEIDLTKFAPFQQKLDARYAKYTQKETPISLLVSAQQFAAQAATSSTREQALLALTSNEDAMRHFIIAQSVRLNTVVPPAAASSDPVLTEAETDDLTTSDVASMVSDFVSGELPKNKRSEWETLGTRNRAALNQNFARELPLEFRGMLKNYYEKVAK